MRYIGTLLVFTVLLLSGCQDPEDEIKTAKAAKPVEAPSATGARFVIEKHGWFKAGHQDNPREILIITDTKTHKEYLGVTGVGITELVKEGKSTREE